MEMNFREYAEVYGGLAGAYLGVPGAIAGGVLGGVPGAIAGGVLGYGAGKLKDRWRSSQWGRNQHKLPEKYLVVYRDLPDEDHPYGRIVQELMPNEYISIGKQYQLKNANLAADGRTYEPHPYFYYGVIDKRTGDVKVVKKIKSGFLQWQRQTRQGYGQHGHGQRQHGQHSQRQYGQRQYGQRQQDWW